MMIHCLRNIRSMTTLQSKISFEMGGGSKRKKTSPDLESYDIVWIGANVGGICSSHAEKVTNGKYKMFVSYDQPINQIYCARIPYEQQRILKSDYMRFSKLAISQYTPSEMSAVKEILPNENAVILSNGRRVGYNHLVIASGLKHDMSQIKGFTEALENPQHPVYGSRDPDSWKGSEHKYSKYISNFNHGSGFFCIPEYPYAGEVECFNFFVSDEVWKWAQINGSLSPKHDFTIMNSNEKFVHHCESADTFIKEQCEKRGIRVEYNTKLLEVSQDDWTATFVNTKTGQKSVRDYQNLYSIIPCRKQEFLIKAGLANQNGMLNVDHQTLQHKQYKNIFGLGDCCDIPTTKTFWGGWYQIAVVRNNVIRSLEGKTLNALYDGFAKVPLFTGSESITYVAHTYGGVGNWQHLKHTNGGMIAKYRYKYWAKSIAKKFVDIYLAKNLGPPYHKFMKTFPELPGTPEALEKKGLLSKLFPTNSEAKTTH